MVLILMIPPTCNIYFRGEFIAHVPQDVFLSDCSLAENIAFGVSLEDIDLKRFDMQPKKLRYHRLLILYHRVIGPMWLSGESS